MIGAKSKITLVYYNRCRVVLVHSEIIDGKEHFVPTLEHCPAAYASKHGDPGALVCMYNPHTHPDVELIHPTISFQALSFHMWLASPLLTQHTMTTLLRFTSKQTKDKRVFGHVSSFSSSFSSALLNIPINQTAQQYGLCDLLLPGVFP